MHRRVQQVAAEERHTSTPSDLLSELHVYTLPQDKWIPFRRLARNTVVEETVSAGFVRVPHDLTLADLRHELRGQLIDEDLPEHFVFIKCVGRNFTQVKPHQEYVVKVKNFLPPRAEEPEIHILEISEELLRYAPSLSNILASDNEFSDSQTHAAASQPSSRLQHYELFRKLDKTVNEDGENEADGNVEGGEAKQRALKAEEEARLAKEAGESPPVKPNVEILSLDASLSGPIASLQEGVISDNLSTRLETVLQEKAKAEDKRLKLFNQARELHEKIQRKREKRRQEWWTAWTDERRKGMQLEEKQGSLRRELDALHQRIIGLIMKRQPLVTGVRDEPSRRANYKISIIRLRHEIEDLKRRVEAMHIKVEAEKKLRSHAEQEVKTLRSEVSRKKANMALTQAKSSSLRHLPLLPRDLVVRM